MSTSGTTWRLGRRPALDGVRGVAVLLVVAYHGLVLVDANYIPAAGTVGVTTFFTLSGFLITSLLLDELEDAGRIRLGAFYARRARRLLPALVVLVAASLLVAWVRPGFVTLTSALASLFYFQNWWSMSHTGGALHHTWSLSIEEQFYLVWPLLLISLAKIGRRAVLWFAIGGAVASVVLRQLFWLNGPSTSGYRIYVGTDTRADALLLGCALAGVMRGIKVERSRPGLVVAATVVAAVSCFMTAWGYQVLSPLTAGLSATALIYASAQARGLRALEVRWLRWLGRRSYGLYLWHMFVYVLIEPWGWVTPATLAVYVTGSLLLTELSWRLIERRWLRPRSADLLHLEPAVGGVERDRSTRVLKVEKLDVLASREAEHRAP